MFIYSFGAISDRGDIRKENQDSVLYLSGKIEGQKAALAVVADGMGGLSYGAQTSRYITTQFERWWQEEFPEIIRDGMDREEDLRELLEQEIWEINQSILAFNHRLNCRSGSTLSLLFLYRNNYYIENIGDSRIYLWRNRQLRQLTQDQSLAAEMVQKGQISEEEAQHCAMKNKLTMCMGMFSVPESNFYIGELMKGDCFLLCSDGFYHPLKREQIEKVIGEKELDAVEKVFYLRSLMEAGKAADNVSAIVVEIR